MFVWQESNFFDQCKCVILSLKKAATSLLKQFLSNGPKNNNISLKGKHSQTSFEIAFFAKQINYLRFENIIQTT